jgi:hypothetical protein
MPSSTSGTAPENPNYNNKSRPRLARKPVAKKLKNTRRQKLSGKLKKKTLVK